MLCAREYQPEPFWFYGVDVHHCPLRDADQGLTTDELVAAHHAAAIVSDKIAENWNVLVTCQHGRNRSGLVCALALVEFGLSPYNAVALIQKRRPKALNNRAFVELVLEEEH